MTAILVGAALGLAGAIVQAITRNPWASPGCSASPPELRLPWPCA
ncbi:iron chelate uptake ABC transporter family permease subunit [Pseudomonas aeruginosa]|nr:iron chelate uptake ABC transporter family permease subunit [Pseudomonas aeruginosa]MDF5927018.1 iron chelate uptake ABC transporter family permease subunit [Pseudomonas aeruginosa]